MYSCKKRRSVPIEFPQSGTGPDSGMCCFKNSSVWACASATVTVEDDDRGQESRLRVHLGDERAHLGELLGGRVDHEVGALGDDVQVVVSDERGDFDDDVAQRLKASHL